MISETMKELRKLDNLNKLVKKGNKKPPSGYPKHCGNCVYFPAVDDKRYSKDCPKEKKIQACRDAKEYRYPPSDQAVESYAGDDEKSEEARKAKELREKEHTLQEIADRLGYTPPTVRNRLDMWEAAEQTLRETKIERFARKHGIDKESAEQYLENPPENLNEIWTTPPCEMWKYRGHWVPDPKGRKKLAKKMIQKRRSRKAEK